MDESLKLPEPSFPSLYERTGDIKDINSLLTNLAELRSYGLACARAALDEAARVCERERVDAEATHQLTDHAYNRAIEDCEAAIRNIKVGE